jgi:hypothetical protein
MKSCNRKKKERKDEIIKKSFLKINIQTERGGNSVSQAHVLKN